MSRVSLNTPSFHILSEHRTAARIAKTVEVYGSENPQREQVMAVLRSQSEKYGFWLSDLGQTRDNAVLIKALDDGAFVDTLGGYGETPLNRAVKGGEVSTLRILLQAGADANFSNDVCGGHPLLQAAERHDLDMVLALRDYGADFDVRNDSGETVLHVAIPTNFNWEHNAHTFDKEGAIALMNYLLGNCGASSLLEVPDSKGITPLARLRESTHFRMNEHGVIVRI